MLHGCATILLGCICNQVLQMQKLTCLITASLFAVHPIHTEAVSSFIQILAPLAGEANNLKSQSQQEGMWLEAQVNLYNM